MTPETGKKVGYLKGLLEGMSFKDSEKEKLFRGIVDVLGELSDRADSFDDLICDLSDYVESIDDDLSLLEDSESPDDDPDGLFEDGDDIASERRKRLHVLRSGDRDEEEDDEEDDDESDDFDGLFDESDFLDCMVCPECKGYFMVRIIPFETEEVERCICPHCKKLIVPEAPSVDNTPVADIPE